MHQQLTDPTLKAKLTRIRDNRMDFLMH